MKDRKINLSTLLCLITTTVSCVRATEYHISINGSDSHDGSVSSPFKTISAAARIAQPGDVITVYAGTYRERINPPRGGQSDAKRIVYRAADGEKVEIKGSEIVTGWKPVEKGVWKVTLPNSFFGDYNPYKDKIAGDWFGHKGRVHHTGEVYLNGKSLYEKPTLKEVLNPVPYPDAFDKEGSTYTWYCESDDTATTIWANFHDADPNKELVEINVRESCFYPDQPGRNYITIRGFNMSQAATQWAPPTAEQVGLVGTHWSKGWIIENNVISDSKCVGITLGKHGDEYDNTSQNSATGYVETIDRALKNGWSKEMIGSHIVRNNTIFDCEAAGICGSMGGVFSEITGNHIYNIQRKRQFVGAETAGIKLHAPIDTLIRNNHVHHADKGIWLDWMTQGTRVSANLCHDNFREDLFVEVSHGPYVVDNNIFLSPTTLRDWSHGGAFVHNLLAGKITFQKQRRQTPYHRPHSTALAGMSDISGGDNRFYNNLFAGGTGLEVYKEVRYPVHANGNAYLKSGKPSEQEINSTMHPEVDPDIKLVQKADGAYLHITLPQIEPKGPFVTTELLGKAKLANQTFTNYDGTPLKVNTDYFGKKRNEQHPTTGPFENIEKGQMVLKVR